MLRISAALCRTRNSKRTVAQAACPTRRPSGPQVSYVIDVDDSAWVVETHDEWATPDEFAEAVRILDTAVTTLMIG